MLKRLGIRLVHETLNHPPSTLELTKKEMIKIGLKYGLASKYTSWIAIDESNKFINANPQAGAIQVKEVPIMAVRHGFLPMRNASRSPLYSQPSHPTGVLYSDPPAAAPGACFGGPGVICEQQQLSLTPMTCSFLDAGAPNSVSNFSLQSSSTLPDFSSFCSAPPPSFGRAPAPSNEDFSDLMSDDLDPHVRLHALVQHQSFDGSFLLGQELGSFFHASVQEMQSTLDEVMTSSCAQGVGDVDAADSILHQLSLEEWRVVWATCLAVVYMEQQLGELQEEWELVVEKAQRKLELMVPSKEVMAQVKEAASKFCKLHHLPQGDQNP